MWEEKGLHKPGAVSNIDTKEEDGCCGAGAYSVIYQTEIHRAI